MRNLGRRPVASPVKILRRRRRLQVELRNANCKRPPPPRLEAARRLDFAGRRSKPLFAAQARPGSGAGVRNRSAAKLEVKRRAQRGQAAKLFAQNWSRTRASMQIVANCSPPRPAKVVRARRAREKEKAAGRADKRNPVRSSGAFCCWCAPASRARAHNASHLSATANEPIIARVNHRASSSFVAAICAGRWWRRRRLAQRGDPPALPCASMRTPTSGRGRGRKLTRGENGASPLRNLVATKSAPMVGEGRR